MNSYRSLVLLAAGILASSANASITSIAGQSDLLTAGPGVGYTADFFQDSLTVVHGWDEVQNYQLTSNLDVDITTNGLFNSLGSLTPGFIAAGTVISSHTLSFDPLQGASAAATFGFDGTIIGVIVLDDAAGTDKFLLSDYLIPSSVPIANIPTAHYGARGCEVSATDSLNVSGSFLHVNLTAASPGDQLRVITTVVPDNSSLLSLSVLALPFFGRRRAKSKR